MIFSRKRVDKKMFDLKKLYFFPLVVTIRTVNRSHIHFPEISSDTIYHNHITKRTQQNKG